MSGLMQAFGLDKVAKLGQIIKNHGGLKGALYNLYWTDDLKVRQNKTGIMLIFLIMFIMLISFFPFRLGPLLEKINMGTSITKTSNIFTGETGQNLNEK